ncbi:MAG: AAA family ATPase [Planctomycetota bacterium]
MTEHRPQPRLRPIIRVFVSSTFSDLKLERDALQQRVFPKLEQLCLKEGFQFQAIDLRWGVSTEAGLDYRTMRICFEELRRSQEVSPEPNFLILLGNRYGWRPLPEEISADEFRSLEQAAGQIGVASQQQQTVEVLRRWYRLDENSLTPVYIFQPRRKPKEGDFDGTDYTTADAWRDVEQVLWQIINRAFPASGLKGRFAAPHSEDQPLPSIVRFQASATEQEIWGGALSVSNASQHVLAFFREIDPPQNIGQAEQIKDYIDLVSGEIDSLSQEAQRDLKAEIKKRLGGNCIDLPRAQLSLDKDQSGKQAVSVSTDHIDELCHEVETRLTVLIERQIKEYWRETKPSSTGADKPAAAEQRTARELEIERDEHLRFGLERGPETSFVGRQEQLDRILAHVKHDSQWPLVIHGASGCGKTALLTRAAQQVAELPICRDHQPIVRFIGVTPRSSDLRSLLGSLCQELRQRFEKGSDTLEGTTSGEGLPPFQTPLSTDIRELIEEFRKHLHMESATAQQPIILFLDALDQLSEADNGRQLFWIPFGPLPLHVKLIVSCLSDRDEQDPVGQPFVVLQRRKLSAENMLNLDALSRDEAQTLLFDRWLQAADRTVNEAQRRLIEQRLESEACRQPLYLKLLFEEVKLWRSYDEPSEPGDGVPALLLRLDVARFAFAEVVAGGDLFFAFQRLHRLSRLQPLCPDRASLLRMVEWNYDPAALCVTFDCDKFKRMTIARRACNSRLVAERKPQFHGLQFRPQLITELLPQLLV